MKAKHLLMLFVTLLVAWFALLIVFVPEMDGELGVIDVVQSWAAKAVELQNRYEVLSYVVFGLLMVIISVIGFPPTGSLIMGGGAVFGIFPAVAIAVPSVSIGGILPFLLSRHFLGRWLESRYPKQLQRIRQGLADKGPFYLFSLRLLPMMPYTSVNLFMGVTTISTLAFVVATMLGRLPLTILYANAGKRIASIDSLADIITPSILLSLCALALLPHFGLLVGRWMERQRLS